MQATGAWENESAPGAGETAKGRDYSVKMARVAADFEAAFRGPTATDKHPIGTKEQYGATTYNARVLWKFRPDGSATAKLAPFF